MKNESGSQPTIVKYVEATNAGIQLLTLSRCAIGYVLRGRRRIYYGDTHYDISRGEIFYLGIGNHYVENLPDKESPFEQIVVYYSSELLQRILLYLNMSYSINISNTHHCELCRRLNHTSTVASRSMRSFFSHIATYFQEDNFIHDQTAENIKLTELIYLVVSHSEGCLKSKVLSNADVAHDNFEQIIYSNIFNDLSIEQLSSMTNRSLTSFKKEFKRHFFSPPHRWFIQQRLLQSRLLLISTSKSISEIGNECAFPNTSHFIKLFKKEYSLTPASYRSQYSAESGATAPDEVLVLAAEPSTADAVSSIA